KRDRPPTTGERKRNGGSPDGRKERRLAPALEAFSRSAREDQDAWSGLPGRGRQDLEIVHYDQVQSDSRGVDPPWDRPPAERPERARVCSLAARHWQERACGRLCPGRQHREGAVRGCRYRGG